MPDITSAEQITWQRQAAHDGGECDCPPGDPWVLPAGETYDTESPF